MSEDQKYHEPDYRSESMNPVTFGRVLGRLEAQGEDIRELKATQAAVVAKLDLLLAYHHKQKGAISTVMAMASAVAAIVGAVISWAVSSWFGVK